MYRPTGPLERFAIWAVVLTGCLVLLQDLLPRLGPWLVACALVGVLARVVWHYTRGY